MRAENHLEESKVKEYAWAITIAFVGSFAITYWQCTSCQTNIPRYLEFAFFSFFNWILLWAINTELNDFLSRRISWIKEPIKRLTIGIVATVVFTALGVVLIITMFEAITSIRFGSYRNVVIPSLIITFFISLFFHGRGFFLQWRKSFQEAERYQRESMTATYESLKSQVNPHFLFNSLNALSNLVYENQDKAVKFIKQLSEVYRYVLETRDKELVPLEEELKFLESYAFLQMIRFGNKLRIEVKLEGVKSLVAPLALQMLFENAVKHNEISEDKPLSIKLFVEGNFLVVENTLQVRTTTAESSSGLGLDNICKRYQFLSNVPVGIEKTASSFIVRIPLIEPLA